MIPKIIWQTYKTSKFDNLPQNALLKSITWKNLNPDFEHKYFNDDDIYNFVKEEYGQEMLDLMNSFKVPVMKADLWRYLVIYKYGGVYADIDTECKKPLNEWFDLDKNMIVAPENGLHYVQYFFAAEAKSPVIKSVIDILVKRCSKINYDMPHFVHHYTGPGVFTDGIRSYFNLKSISHNCSQLQLHNNCFHRYLQNEAKLYKSNAKMTKEKFFCYSGDDEDMFKEGNVRHYFGSHYWKDEGYQSWIEDPLAKKSRA